MAHSTSTQIRELPVYNIKQSRICTHPPPPGWLQLFMMMILFVSLRIEKHQDSKTPRPSDTSLKHVAKNTLCPWENRACAWCHKACLQPTV